MNGTPRNSPLFPYPTLFRSLKRRWPARDPYLPRGWTPIDDGARLPAGDAELEVIHTPGHAPDHVALWHAESRDRKSTRLNSSHANISYAVFCLKKKKTIHAN